MFFFHESNQFDLISEPDLELMIFASVMQSSSALWKRARGVNTQHRVDIWGIWRPLDPWKVLEAFLGPDKLISICRSHLAEVQSFMKLIRSFYFRNILTGGEVACCYLSHKSLHSEIPRI